MYVLVPVQMSRRLCFVVFFFFLVRSPLAQAVSVQARVGLGFIRLQERQFPVFVVYWSDWSERRGLSFHISTWLVGSSRRDIFLFVEYWLENLRSSISLLFGLFGVD